MKRLTKTLLGIFLLGILTFSMSSCDMEPPIPPQSNKDISDALFEAGKKGVKAGAKEVGKKALTSLGKSLIEGFLSPEISDLLFGKKVDIDRVIEEIIEEIRLSDADIRNRLRRLENETSAQLEADYEAFFTSTNRAFLVWNSEPDLYKRISDLQTVREIWTPMDNLMEDIETLILNDRNTGLDLKMAKLELLPLHIMAAQLAITANAYYYNTEAIKVAFETSPMGSDKSRFNEWVSNLSESDINDINEAEKRDDFFRGLVIQNLASFFDQASKTTYVEDYVNSLFTPMVSQMVTFEGNTDLFDNSDYMQEANNWKAKDNNFVRLDGIRAYYYVDIPEASCLEGKAYENLTETSNFPWMEVSGDPQASNCNRFWITDPYIESSTFPGPEPHYLSSLDGYKIWFLSTESIYTNHQKYLENSLIHELFGPTSLILDKMYEEHTGNKRPNTDWDKKLITFQSTEAMFQAVDSYEDGITEADVILAVIGLNLSGFSIEKDGFEVWKERLRTALK